MAKITCDGQRVCERLDPSASNLEGSQEICAETAGGFQPVVVDFGQFAKPNAYLLKRRAGAKLLLRGALHQMGVGKGIDAAIPLHILPKPDSQTVFLFEV
jgi:hypothetical protein